MPEFMDTIETIRADEASTRRLFNSERNDIPVGTRGRARSPEYRAQLAEAARLVADVVSGRKRIHYLQEAMTTSDFPFLFGDILDRQLLANYEETPQTFRDYVHISTVRDFRTVNRFVLNGGEGRLAEVPQRTEYPQDTVSDARYQYAVTKKGKKFTFDWEDIINDDLEALTSIPERMARGARRTEEFFATDLFFGSTGPDTGFFTAGNKNVVTSNPALTINALQTAFIVLRSQLDTSGEPIFIDAVQLVVPPALEVTAQNLLNATQLWLTSLAGGIAGEQVNTVNWMQSRVGLSVNPYIPIIATTNGATSWMLIANPDVGRPAAEMGFLRGHTSPELFMKSSNAISVGGGMTNELDGDFDTDSIEWKIRHVFGGTLMDPKMAVASNGTGS